MGSWHDLGFINQAVGFIGLGVMGNPMATNMLRAGVQLVVWNRTQESTDNLAVLGATVARTVEDVFVNAGTVIVMLVNGEAIDQVLGRDTPAFARRIAGHTVIVMSSVAPDYACALAADVVAAGGRYVEAPVSGSRKPAEAGQLVALLAGDDTLVESIRPLLAPMCSRTVLCGSIGNGLRMKLAVNMYLNTMLAALAEATHFASKVGLDLQCFEEAIAAGPMACDVTHVKAAKLVARDFSVQAATSDALASCRLISDEARVHHIASPLLDRTQTLYAEAVDLGYGRMDMVSVLAAIEVRTGYARCVTLPPQDSVA